MKGPIAAVQDGDLIKIDIPNRQLNVLISEVEMKSRLAVWKRRAPDAAQGFLSLYMRLVSGADQGAILQVPDL